MKFDRAAGRPVVRTQFRDDPEKVTIMFSPTDILLYAFTVVFPFWASWKTFDLFLGVATTCWKSKKRFSPGGFRENFQVWVEKKIGPKYNHNLPDKLV
jgi:hypothetical protein